MSADPDDVAELVRTAGAYARALAVQPTDPEAEAAFERAQQPARTGRRFARWCSCADDRVGGVHDPDCPTCGGEGVPIGEEAP